MTDGIRIGNSVRQNWAAAISDGEVTLEEGGLMVEIVKADGVITREEMSDLDAISQEMQRAYATTVHSLRQQALQAGLSGADPVASIAHLTGLEAMARQNTQVAQAMAAHAAEGLRTFGRVVDAVADDMSYGVLDWVITDGEARHALSQLERSGAYAGMVLTALAQKEGGLYLQRLFDQLPARERGRLGDLLADRCTNTILRNVRDAVGHGRWAQVTRASAKLRDRDIDG